MTADTKRAPIDRLVRPFQLFAQNKVAGAILLIAATAAALVWANSPWSDSYEALLSTHVRVGFGGAELDKPLILWINDGLMAVFFFVVGLEIKREIIAGELATMRKAALPIAGAIGGMVAPAAVYIALNAGGAGQRGWGVPMATDIAFALGVLLLLGSRVPIGLKVFLTALAIVDDIGAILVIAVFYTETIALGSLIVGLVGLALSAAANAAGVRNSLFYFLIGLVVWTAFLKSGVHATLAAVLMAMTIPARTVIDGAGFVSKVRSLLGKLERSGIPKGHGLLTSDQHHEIQQLDQVVTDATAPLQRLEHAQMPFVTFVVLPVFALANAGVVVDAGMLDALSDPVCLGVILGLVLGKQAGILGFAWLAVKLRIADRPANVGWSHLHGAAVLGGIGFTMSLFVAGLAFTDPAQIATAKLGILAASLVCGIGGWLYLRTTLSRETNPPPDAAAQATA